MLEFPCGLPQVGCSPPAVVVRLGLGGFLVTVGLFPPCFLFCACAASPSAASPSGFCPLTEWVGMSVSSLLVYSYVWLEGSCCAFFLSACALFSLLQVCWDFLASRAPLCWGSWGFPPCLRVFLLRCGLLGLQVGFPLLPFPCLREGVLLAQASPEFVGYVGGFGCPSWFIILFRCLLVHLLFLELRWFLVTSWWLLLRLLVLVSSDTRSHIPDAFASSDTPISAVGWSWCRFFLALCLGFVLLASRVRCWLGVIEVFPLLSSLHSFAAAVVTLVICRVLVGLPLGSCCSSGLRG